MISLTTLYDEYIDRSKLSEQKKPSWVYSSSPLQEGSEQKSHDNIDLLDFAVAFILNKGIAAGMVNIYNTILWHIFFLFQQFLKDCF